MKKHIAVFLCLIMVLGMLAGCSGGSKTETAAPADSGATYTIKLGHACSAAQRPCLGQDFGFRRHETTPMAPSMAVTISKSVIASACRARRNPPRAPRSESRSPARLNGTTILLMNFSEMDCDSAISPIVRGSELSAMAMSRSTLSA